MLMLTVITLLVATTAFAAVDLRAMGSTVQVCLDQFLGRQDVTLLMCTDIDECQRDLDNCDINAECSNTVGSFHCTCNMGYTGTGIMSDCSKFHTSLFDFCI